MKDMSPELRRLLDDNRATDDPTAADRDRVRAALVAGLAAGGGAATAGGSKLGLLGRAGLVALVGALLAGGVWWFASTSGSHDHRQAAPAPREGVKGWSDEGAALPPATIPDAAPVVAAPDAAPVVAAPDAAPRVAIEEPTRPRPKPKTRDVDQLAEEARLLREAETARRAGALERASQKLDEHHRRFPKGALATEREAARVLLLCDAGRAAEANELAARFLRRYPRSPLADRVRSACERSIP